MKKPRKQYRKTAELTPAKKKFAQVYAETDNASHAVRQAYPELSKTTSAEYIRTKAKRLITNDHVIREIMERKAVMEVNADLGAMRLQELIRSNDEQVAFNSSKFAIEQSDGKATQRILQRSAHVFVSYDLTGGNAGDVPQEVLDQLA